jgi:hypothetical protein
VPFAVVSQTGPDDWKIRSVRASLTAIRKMARRDLGAGVLEWVVEIPKGDKAWKPGDRISWRTWTRIVPDDEGAMTNPKQQPDTEPGNYYVSIIRDGRVGLLAGPFRKHADALAMVDQARTEAEKADPRAAFDSFGTVRLADDYTKPGVLNARLGLSTTNRNPEVHRKPGAAIVSETNALGMIRQLATDIARAPLKDARDNAATIVAYCDVLLGQVKSGVHANPSLVTFLASNPPASMMSRHVQAICYKHIQDGDFYIHTFGGRDVPFHEKSGRQFIFLDELPATTGVEMRSDKKIVVLARPDGKPLADDF